MRYQEEDSQAVQEIRIQDTNTIHHLYNHINHHYNKSIVHSGWAWCMGICHRRTVQLKPVA